MAFQFLVSIGACLLACADWAVSQSAAEVSKKRPKIEKLKDGSHQLGKIKFDPKTREITFAAKVNMNVGYLEYILVNEITGKIHESLLSTQISPTNLNVVLLLLNYEPSSLLRDQKEDVAVAAQPKSSLDVLVKWRGENGKELSAPVESWVLNLATESPAKSGHWLYTGSKHDDGGGFAAETDGSIIAVYGDQRSLLNNPREGKSSDEIWKPAPQQGLPAKETPVTVVLRPHINAKD